MTEQDSATTAPTTITVEREKLFGLVAQLAAAEGLLDTLASGVGDSPVCDFFYTWLDVGDDWLGITWEEDLQQNNPIYHRGRAAAYELHADMLAAIVADPHEALVPYRMTRLELHARVEELRKLAAEGTAKAEALEEGRAALCAV